MYPAFKYQRVNRKLLNNFFHTDQKNVQQPYFLKLKKLLTFLKLIKTINFYKELNILKKFNTFCTNY